VTTTIIVPLITSNAYAQQSHSLVANTYNIPADGTTSIPFTIPSGVPTAYLSGTVLITRGILSTVDFSIVNTDTGAKVMSQGYSGQGNIGLYLPAGSYTIYLHIGSILAGETHIVTLTLNLNY